MTPQSNMTTENLKKVEYSDQDFKLGDGIIVGKVKGIEELKQSIFWILNTERYQYIIYDWNIGIETNDLYGMPVTYVCSELENRVKDALSILDKIEEVYDFEFDTSKKRIITCTFKVKSVYGEFEYNKEVNY